MMTMKPDATDEEKCAALRLHLLNECERVSEFFNIGPKLRMATLYALGKEVEQEINILIGLKH